MTLFPKPIFLPFKILPVYILIAADTEESGCALKLTLKFNILGSEYKVLKREVIRCKMILLAQVAQQGVCTQIAQVFDTWMFYTSE